MKTKKVGVIALSALMAVSSFAACGKPAVSNDENTLQIYAKEAGYGVEWLYKVADAFKAEYPEYTISIETEQGVDRGQNLLTAGPKHTTEDLLFVGKLTSLIAQGDKAVAGYDHAVANLTEMYNMEVPGEGVTLLEKTHPDILEVIKFEEETEDGVWEDQYFTFPYQNGMLGFVYNKTMFEEKKVSVPRTTEELYEVCDTLKKDVSPMLASLSVSYVSSIGDMWWAQYEGVDEYKRYWNPTSLDDYETMRQKGKLHMLMVQNQLNKKTYGRLSRDSIDTNYTESQAKFINREAAILYCGGWFENEMKMIIDESQAGGNKDEYGMMMTPLNSAIAERLSFWDKSLDYYEVMRDGRSDVNPDAAKLQILKDADAKLVQIVDYVDGVTTEKPAFATDEDIAIVKGSRNLMIAYGANAQAVIPAYATAKEAAMKFLLFLATDKMQRVVAQNCAGSTMPFTTYDVLNDDQVQLSSFARNVHELTNKAKLLAHSEMMKGGWLMALPDAGGGKTFAVDNLDDYKDPMSFFEASLLTLDEYKRALRVGGIL